MCEMSRALTGRQQHLKHTTQAALPADTKRKNCTDSEDHSPHQLRNKVNKTSNLAA